MRKLKTWFKPALLTLLVFLVSLVATIPARWAQQFLPDGTAVNLQSVDGTIWNGEAAELIWQNNPLGKLEWSVKPMTLLTGKLGLDFKLSDDALNADGTALVYRDQVVVLKQTSANAEVNALPLARSKLPVELEGRVEVDMEKVVIKDNAVHAAEGIINWRNARITAPILLPMGEVTMEVSGTKGNLKGELKSNKSAVDTRGTLELTNKGQLSSNIKLKPNAQTPEDIKELLPALGKPQRDGTVTLTYRGRIRF